MNHFVFPEGENISQEDRGRYGVTAIPLITKSLLNVDGNIDNYTAKIFGGASPLNANTGIGSRNIAIAEKHMAEFGIPIVEKITGGTAGYRIYFDTLSGEVKTEEINKHSAQKAQNKRVLIVDDSSTVRKVLCSVVNAIDGYEVCGMAEDAFQARDLLVSLEPDIMILDIIMPKLDGISFLERVTKHFPTPVIICSTIAKEGTPVRNDAFKAGAVEVIDKDTLELYKNPDQVRRTIKEKLQSALIKFVKPL